MLISTYNSHTNFDWLLLTSVKDIVGCFKSDRIWIYLPYTYLGSQNTFQVWEAPVHPSYGRSIRTITWLIGFVCTFPCNGVVSHRDLYNKSLVSHGAEFGVLRAFTDHTRKNKRKTPNIDIQEYVHDPRAPCDVLCLFVFTLDRGTCR